MTPKEKNLLLQDLCSRLPHGVIVDIKYNKEHGSSDRLRICSEGNLTLNTDLIGLYIEEEIYLKPYLRSMSSMTEDERKEYLAECDKDNMDAITTPRYHGIEWLIKNMFDYRGLIPMSLALEAPEGMYD